MLTCERHLVRFQFGLTQFAAIIAPLLVLVDARQPSSSSSALPPADNEVNSTSLRVKRQSSGRTQIIYYLCGQFPNIVYSLTRSILVLHPPAPHLACPICRNGGRDLSIDCTTSAQCTQYSTGTVACVDNRCCSAPDNYGYGYNYDSYSPYNPYPPYNEYQYYPNNPYNPNSRYLASNPYGPYYSGTPFGAGAGPTWPWQYPDYGSSPYQQLAIYGRCPSGYSSNIRCSAIGQCPFAQICLNGLCCPPTGNDFAKACGGQMAISACQGGMCDNGLFCTPSNFCCQCPTGRSGGLCNQGGCLPGYYCHGNGYCCADCPDKASPFGACPNQRAELCGGGSRCSPGDICCLSQFLP